ncbi:MAG: hypothetical protein IV094_11500 [Vitreoscilla sp.]|nr:hypothetical protein [Vitreoscilla sp.]
MSYCDLCGTPYALGSAACTNCGADLRELELAFAAAVPVGAAEAASTVRAAPDSRWQAAGIVGLAVVAVALLTWSTNGSPRASGWHVLGWILAWLVVLPVASGAALVAVCDTTMPGWLQWFSAWADRRAAATRVSTGRFSRWVMRPVMWLQGALKARCERIQHEAWRNGAQAASYVFAVCLFLLLTYVLTVIVVTIVLVAITLFFVGLVLRLFDFDGPSHTEERPLRWFRKAGKVYEGTNILNERLVGRTDEQGNRYAGTNMFNERKVGRVDEQGKVFEGSGWLDEKQVGRIDEQGHMYEGSGWLDEKRTGRVDKDGRIIEGDGWLNEKPVGRVKSDE